jgi:hypothetical protein
MMPLPRIFSPCYEKGYNTAGKYHDPNVRHAMAAYYTNNDYESSSKIPDDYGYSRATTMSQPLGILDKPNPSTASNSSRSSQLCKIMLNDTEQTTTLVYE